MSGESQVRVLKPTLSEIHTMEKQVDGSVYQLVSCMINNRDIQIITIVSPDREKSKSNLAGYISIALAQAGRKVLLLDANLGEPHVHQFFNLTNHKGLSGILSGKYHFEDVIYHVVNAYHLDVITSGGVEERDSSQLLHPIKMKNFIEKVKEQYDFIIIDTPAASDRADAAILSGMADGVLFVIAPGKTYMDSAKRAKEILLRSGANILGSVLID